MLSMTKERALCIETIRALFGWVSLLVRSTLISVKIVTALRGVKPCIIPPYSFLLLVKDQLWGCVKWKLGTVEQRGHFEVRTPASGLPLAESGNCQLWDYSRASVNWQSLTFYANKQMYLTPQVSTLRLGDDHLDLGLESIDENWLFCGESWVLHSQGIRGWFWESTVCRNELPVGVQLQSLFPCGKMVQTEWELQHTEIPKSKVVLWSMLVYLRSSQDVWH